MNIPDTIEWFDSIRAVNSPKDDTTKDGFFCGMTNDMETIKELNKKTLLCYTKCNTFETAKELEKQMFIQGYPTNLPLGKGDKDTIYDSKKYSYTPKTIEEFSTQRYL